MFTATCSGSVRWSEAGHYGQAMEAAQGPRMFPEVFQCVGGVAAVRTQTASELLHLYCVQMAPSSLLPTPSFPEAALLVRTEQRSDNGCWRRVFGFCTGISCWGSLSQCPLLPQNLVQTVETFNITDEKCVIPSSPSLATGMLWPSCAQLEGKTFEGGSKNIDMHTYLLYKHMCLLFWCRKRWL